MNAPVYASRFADEDRERIWREYVARLDAYRQQLDLKGIELYSGGNSGPSATTDVLQRFTRNMPGLEYILTDLGRHTDTTPDNASQILDGVAVFRTLTNFRIWTTSEEVHRRTMDGRKCLAPPGDHIARADGASWVHERDGQSAGTTIPAWLNDLHSRFPADYEAVSPDEMARLLRERRQAHEK